MFFEGINAAMKQAGFSKGLDRLAAECPLTETLTFKKKLKQQETCGIASKVLSTHVATPS